MRLHKGNVLKFPVAATQARRLALRARSDKPIPVSILLMPDRDRRREQRTWRFIFGLYQDCASVPWSKGFKKTPGMAWEGKMRPSRVPEFLREASWLLEDGSVVVLVDGEKPKKRLLDVIAG